MAKVHTHLLTVEAEDWITLIIAQISAINIKNPKKPDTSIFTADTSMNIANGICS